MLGNGLHINKKQIDFLSCIFMIYFKLKWSTFSSAFTRASIFAWDAMVGLGVGMNPKINIGNFRKQVLYLQQKIKGATSFFNGFDDRIISIFIRIVRVLCLYETVHRLIGARATIHLGLEQATGAKNALETYKTVFFPKGPSWFAFTRELSLVKTSLSLILGWSIPYCLIARAVTHLAGNIEKQLNLDQ